MFKGTIKSFGLANAKVSILLNNVLQHCFWGWKKKLLFYIKKIILYGDGDEAGIAELIGDGDEIQFIISVGYG